MTEETRRAAESRRRLKGRQKREPPARSADEANGEGFLFDPYWDEEFSSYFDPTLKTCCQIRY